MMTDETEQSLPPAQCDVAIIGKHRVSAAKIKTGDGLIQTIDCDGLIFSDEFNPESALTRLGNITIDPHTAGPVVDQYGRCSDENFFATGNLLRPVDTAGWCGAKAGKRLVMLPTALITSCPHQLPDPF